MGILKELPDEILLSVFKHLEDKDLTQIARVCKRWWQLYHDPCLWRSRTFEFRGYCRSQNERLQQSLTKYLSMMGRHLRCLRVVCSSPNLLTAYSEAQCVEHLLSGLSTFKEGRRSIREFHMSHLHFDETWSCFRSSKCLLVDTIIDFLSLQKNLRLFNMHDSYMTPPFGFRVVKALSRSKSANSLEVVNVVDFYSMEASKRIIGVQLRYLSTKCCNLREIALNYSYLYATKVVDLCENLQATLKKLILYLSFWEYARPDDIISSDRWKLARKVCPNLRVSVRMTNWSRDPAMFLGQEMPLVHLGVQGGQCRYSSLTFVDKTVNLLNHLAKNFAPTLKSISLEADGSSGGLRLRQGELSGFLACCTNVRYVTLSDSILSLESLRTIRSAFPISPNGPVDIQVVNADDQNMVYC
ncbi:F-box only protein 39 [Aplysia californica]|uniref:F-box only protein 39 n=1 Tax=Aplysia californica TaxID=6500 RepID=A0ABM1A097_APLCA|nr:F-box only protein 39 [Aplysia californica]